MKYYISEQQLKAEGSRYEDRYGGYLEIFHSVSDLIDAGERVIVVGAPWSWIALMSYMGVEDFIDPVVFFTEADSIARPVLKQYGGADPSRSVVEALCALRPETVDALWKVDRQWKTKVHSPSKEREFIVTSNGSFDRPEIQEYERALSAYAPTKQKVVLVPCAADKPYPAEMHKAVLAMMPDDFYFANVTGVLGIIPQDLWPVMPHYDSGIPNEWRCMNVLMDYFTKHKHTQIISYCDFYNMAIRNALTLADVKGPETDVIFVNPVKFYADYMNLLAPERLDALQRAFTLMGASR